MKRLPEFKLVLEPLTDEARSVMGFQYAAPEIGQRFKIGGRPDFLQSEEKLVVTLLLQIVD